MGNHELKKMILIFGRTSASKYLSSLDKGSTSPKGMDAKFTSIVLSKVFDVDPKLLQIKLEESHEKELLKKHKRRIK